MKRACALALLAAVCLAGGREAFGLSAETLPKGYLLLGVQPGYSISSSYFGYSFGTKTRSVVSDYDGVVIDPSIFLSKEEAVQLFLDIGYGPAEAAQKADRLFDDYKIGETKFEMDMHGFELPIQLAYGITDDLTFMARIPVSRAYYNAKIDLIDSHVTKNPICASRLRSRLDISGSCFDPESEMGAFNMPIKPVAEADRKPGSVLGKDELAEFLMSDVYGFEYGPLPEGKHAEWGLGDMLLAGLYKLDEGQYHRIAYANWLKVPTGRYLSPDVIYEQKFGDGQTDLGFLLLMDVKPFGGARPLNLFSDAYISLALGYTIQFPDDRPMRVWSFLKDTEGNTSVLPLATKDSTVNLHRDYGDTYDLFFSGGTRIWDFFGFDWEVYWYYQNQDQYWGPNPKAAYNRFGAEYAAMEWESNRSSLDLSLSVSFNTIPWALKGKFLPMVFAFNYGRSIAGMNIDQVVRYSGTVSVIVPLVDLITGNLGAEPAPEPAQKGGEE